MVKNQLTSSVKQKLAPLSTVPSQPLSPTVSIQTMRMIYLQVCYRFPLLLLPLLDWKAELVHLPVTSLLMLYVAPSVPVPSEVSVELSMENPSTTAKSSGAEFTPSLTRSATQPESMEQVGYNRTSATQPRYMEQVGYNRTSATQPRSMEQVGYNRTCPTNSSTV